MTETLTAPTPGASGPVSAQPHTASEPGLPPVRTWDIYQWWSWHPGGPVYPRWPKVIQDHHKAMGELATSVNGFQALSAIVAAHPAKPMPGKLLARMRKVLEIPEFNKDVPYTTYGIPAGRSIASTDLALVIGNPDQAWVAAEVKRFFDWYTARWAELQKPTETPKSAS